MTDFYIDGATLQKMIISGTNLLTENKRVIDALNVFPVPDGDTGTNMSLTLHCAVNEMCKSNSNRVCDVAKAASSGSLRGARGNSGVIISQLLRGFAKALEGKETAHCADIAQGFVKATEAAYKAVMKPKEGTILTVARIIAEKAAQTADNAVTFDDFTNGFMEAGNDILQKTTNMLPQLKEANVVDAGGKGLVIFLQGAINGLYAEDVELKLQDTAAPADTDFNNFGIADIVYAYCTEFCINLSDSTLGAATETELKTFLEPLGDSVVIVTDDTIIKVHAHTNNPGLVLEEALKHGFLSNVKIENMKLQHTGLITSPMPAPEKSAAPLKETGVVAVALGDGLAKVFKELGADAVIEGGQTMNPSTEDFLKAIKGINAKSIILLPNNKNVILAAEQAAKLTKNKKVYTVPTRTIPEGFAAMVCFVSTAEASKTAAGMAEAINAVKTGELTYAVRNTELNGKKIKKGDIIGLTEGQIRVVSKSIEVAAFELLKTMTADTDPEIITIYYGAGVTKSDAEALAERISEHCPDTETETYYGGQPHYYYIFSVE